MSNSLKRYVKGLTEPEEAQSASDAATDPQINSLTLSITTAIRENPGSGKGGYWSGCSKILVN